MVTEAQNKVNQTVKQTMKYIGHLAVVTTTDISFPEESNIPASSLQVKKCFLEILIMNSNSSVEFTFTISNCTQQIVPYANCIN